MSFTFRFDSLLRLLQRRQKETELQLLQATQRMHRLHGIQQATSRAIDAMAWPESPALPAVLTQSTSAYPDKIDIVRQTTQAEIAEQESVLVRMRGELAAIRQRVIQLEQLRGTLAALAGPSATPARGNSLGRRRPQARFRRGPGRIGGRTGSRGVHEARVIRPAAIGVVDDGTSSHVPGGQRRGVCRRLGDLVPDGRAAAPSHPAPLDFAESVPAVAVDSQEDPMSQTTNLPTIVREQPLSPEELFRFSALFQQQQESLNHQRQSLEQRQQRIQLMEEDMRRARLELDGLRAETADVLKQGEELLQQIQQERAGTPRDDRERRARESDRRSTVAGEFPIGKRQADLPLVSKYARRTGSRVSAGTVERRKTEFRRGITGVH